jgi:hypothetical protein
MSAGFGRLTMEEPAPCHSFKSKQGGTQSRPPKPMPDDSRGPQRQVVLSFDSRPFSGRFPASSGRFQHSQSAISRICGALKCWCAFQRGLREATEHAWDQEWKLSRRVIQQKGSLGSVCSVFPCFCTFPRGLLQFVAFYQVSLNWRLVCQLGGCWDDVARGRNWDPSSAGPKMQWTQGHPNGMIWKR